MISSESLLAQLFIAHFVCFRFCDNYVHVISPYDYNPLTSDLKYTQITTDQPRIISIDVIMCIHVVSIYTEFLGSNSFFYLKLFL